MEMVLSNESGSESKVEPEPEPETVRGGVVVAGGVGAGRARIP